MTIGYIYKIVFPNNKHYIGQTKNLKKRLGEHKNCAKKGDTRCLYKALRKYNMIDTFELIEIDRADIEEELCKKEMKYIVQFNSHYINGNGYNMTNGGEGIVGYIYTDEDRQKVSETLINYYKENPDARQKVSEAAKKQFENPDARQQMSETLINYYKENPDARQQMSETLINYYKENPDARQQMSETLINYYKENPDARQQISEAAKKQWENPDARQQMSEIIKKHYEHNPEAKKKILNAKGQNKPFDIFKLDGTFIKTFTYQCDAREYLQKEHNITSTIKIGEVLCGNRKSSAGFVFKYK